MKNILCLISILMFFVIASFAQVPQGFKYQSVARSSTGLPIASANIGLRVSVRDQTATGTIVYSETHIAATNAFGVFTVSVGAGTAVSGTFASIAWGTGAKFIEIEADFSGGTSYTSMGISQLLSVPYALYSQNGTPGPQGPVGLTGSQGPAGPAGILSPGAVAGNTSFWNGSSWVLNSSNIFNNGGNVGIGTTSPVAKLDIAGTIKISDGSQGLGRVLTSDANGLATWTVASGWGLNGTSGTMDGTNFIGTTDNAPLNFRVNNQKAGRIDFASPFSTFYGYQSGISNIGEYNAANGYQALYSNTTGIANTANGYQALYSNTTGSSNTAIGYTALYSNTAGGNTATGHSALGSNTTGVRNTANGLHALIANTTGYFNTATGSDALFFNTTGFENTANGKEALFQNTTGTYNTATGVQALGSNTTGKANTATGRYALTFNTVGDFNTAHGAFALYHNNTGISNTAIGFHALDLNTTGSNNIAIGTNALYQNTTGTNNTALGYQALYGNITGNNNTALGYNANVSTDALTNATAIGYNAVVSASNSLVLGGTGTDAVKVGIGVTAPAAFLDVAGNVKIADGTQGAGKVLTSDANGLATWNTPGIGGSGTVNYLPKFTPNGTTAGNSLLFDDGTNVGIGTAAPSAKLEVAGNVAIPATNDYSYSSAKTKSIVIGNAAFEAAGNGLFTVIRNVASVPGIPVSVQPSGGTTGSITALVAPVNFLPDGAVITNLTAYVWDISSTYDLTVLLTRQPFGTITIDNMASVSSTGAPPAATYTTSAITNGAIDNTSYSYQVVLQSLAGPSHGIFQVKLTYTITKVD